MKVRFEGRDWELGLSDIDLKPAIVIQGYMGMSINKWVDSLNDKADEDGGITWSAADQPEYLKSLGALYWLMKQQNGVHYPIADTNFPVGAFSQAMAEAQAAEAAAQIEEYANSEPEPDPTSPPPPASEPSPEPASTPTPPPSGNPDDGGSPGG